MMLKARMEEQLFLEQLLQATYYKPVTLLDVYISDQPEERIRLHVTNGAEDIVAPNISSIRFCLQHVLTHLKKPPVSLLCRAVCYVTDDREVKISLFVDVPRDVHKKFSPLVLEIKRAIERRMTGELAARYLDPSPGIGA